MILRFPPVEMADDSGLLAMGGDLEVSTLELAYRNGIFPWPVEGQPLFWFAPPKRAILEFDGLRIPDRLRRFLRSVNFAFRVDVNFENVIRACAASTNRGQAGTWITPGMIEAYTAFHECGFAHSFETHLHGELVGGLYGVRINNYFAAESMFYKASNASKFALVKTVDYLRGAGLTWLDVQIQSPFLETLGVAEVSRPVFMEKLRAALD